MIDLLQSWGITIQTPYNANILYESERGLGNDGERIVKLYSENFEYKVECAEYYKVIELDKDMEIISEIIKRGKIEDVININNIRIIDSMPIPVCEFVRAHFSKCFKDEASYGICPSKKRNLFWI